MKYTIYDNETNEKYDCENEYEFKIKSFTQKQQFNYFDDEVIKMNFIFYSFESS